MSRWIMTFGLLTALVLGSVAAQAQSLIISEYVEGSSNNKAIEIYNPTGAAVDLAASTAELHFYFNGSTSAGTVISLTGVIPAGGTWVVANSSAAAGILAVADQLSGASFYNGDDAVALAVSGTEIDIIGQIGVDPGSEWGSGDQSTQDNTLRRDPSICSGDTDGSDAFDPSIQWLGFPTDTFDGLGSHSADCSPIPTDAESWGVVKVRFH